MAAPASAAGTDAGRVIGSAAALASVALPTAPLTMSGLRELKTQLSGQPARRAMDSDDDDSEDERPKKTYQVNASAANTGRVRSYSESSESASGSGSESSEESEEEVLLRPVFRPKVTSRSCGIVACHCLLAWTTITCACKLVVGDRAEHYVT